ncbi:vicilin-like seed storage protein At2g28490 isoform X2 [Bidens hawaiensis]|uniref:vicilin-like seed storage protein At2g28490 isoform X2 n=1 Tax=Bidens hawaiensis TaxID=980011 RepID=UPI0040499CB8
MAKMLSKCVFILLALAVAISVLVAEGRNHDHNDDSGYDDGKDRRASKVFPSEEGGYGPRYGPGHGHGQDPDRRASKVFPPEEQYEHGEGGYFPPGQEYGPGGAGGASLPGGGGRTGWTEKRRYILSDFKRVVKTDAGGMRVVRGVGGKYKESPMHIGFITMEPNSMFIPQYLDSSIIFFIETGEARIGSIYKDNLVEKDLKAGDLYQIQAGSAFYIVNTAQGQRLQIITSIDTAESIDWESFESFSLTGGANPRSVLAGFDLQTLLTALNVSTEVVGELLTSRQEGAIVFLNPDSSTSQPSMWTRFLEQGNHERKTQMMRIANVGTKKTGKEAKKLSWSLRNQLVSVFRKVKGKDDDLGSYNIYGDKEADFRNDFGWSLQVDGDDFKELRLSDFAVYLVNLTAGAMMAPHINPTATEYGVVLSGTGNIQVVYPNGTLAMDAQVTEGDVFWIPRYFPFCQVASRSGPFVFFGFTTSARDNRPQFLAGQGSVLQTMMGQGFAAAFGLSEDELSRIFNAQGYTTILPSASAAPGGGGGEIPEGEGQGDPGYGGEAKIKMVSSFV